MSLHPLVDLAADKEVRKAAGFRAIASELTGERLAELYNAEMTNAPRRQDAGRKYFVAYNKRLGAQRKPGRDDEHVSLALVEHTQRTGDAIALPDAAGDVVFVQAQVPLKSAAEDKSKGDMDPNKGVGRLDLLGVGPEDRMVIGQVRFLAPSATRGRTGDTPLRALLEGLAAAAVAQANTEALREEVAAKAGRTLSDGPPLLLLIGSPKYWELCRKREAQKGAAWIKEMERLAGEVKEATGVDVVYLSTRLDGDPGWAYPDGMPVLEAAPRLDIAWEYGAGRVRPKPKPRPKAVDPADLPVEPDLSRPVRDYAQTETFERGDRIQHATLGLGVVQGIAGNGKIHVLFGDRKSVLIHGRAATAGVPAPSVPPHSA
ncbi:MAG: hypothetical protein VX546_06375 [Myxococcota bacterium]|nr:hypothetical protein [Myxococcota bacterium]